MTHPTYAPGDLVQLKSGGPVMTVCAMAWTVHDVPPEDRFVLGFPEVVWADYSPDGKTITRWSGHVSMVERVRFSEVDPTVILSADETPTARQTLDDLRAECERLEEELAAMTTQLANSRRRAADADKARSVADKLMMAAEKRANTAETALGQWKAETLALRAQVADLTTRLAEVVSGVKEPGPRVRSMAADMLSDYAAYLGGRTCDDYDWPEDMPIAWRVGLVHAFHEYNDDGDEEWLASDLQNARDRRGWQESSVVFALAHLLRGEELSDDPALLGNGGGPDLSAPIEMAPEDPT